MFSPVIPTYFEFRLISQVIHGIGNTPLVPGYLQQKTAEFIRGAQRARFGLFDYEEDEGWCTAEKHAYYLMQDYLFTHNPNSKLELEEFLRTF